MAELSRLRLPSPLVLAIFFAATAATAGAQAPCASSTQVASRIAGDWHASAPVPLNPSKPAVVPAGIDLGVVSANLRLERMLLLLEASPAQQLALDTFLQNQQRPGNCAYRQWLTPSQFADSFANSAADVAAISAWLTQQGLEVAPVPSGRGWIEFSGTAAQVEQAFGAVVHGYSTTAGTRYGLTSGIHVPAVFLPLIGGLVSLDGAISTPALTTPRTVAVAPSALAAQTSLGQAEALTPQLLAPLLHLDSLQATGVTGAGQTIAIAARSNVQTADIAAFRSTFGLPASPLSVLPVGPDPGLTGDQAEAELAASWAGAAAPGANILLAPAASTASTDGIDLSLAAIVDQIPGHTLVIDFSSCESALSDAHQAFYAAAYRQAAAEGMAVIVAAGDSGAAACHAPADIAPVSAGYSINALAATPWNTAVGAAAFAASDGSSLAAWSPVAAADPAYAGGGGRSTVFRVPEWQASIQPTSSGRMLPDLALPTGVDSVLNKGVAFCFSGAAAPSGCTLMRSGGSSAAAAIFGGIAALIAQQDGAEGNLAPALYSVSGRNGVFNDVQQGTATLPCVTGSPDCRASGRIGYTAANGYDLATGLGSPNAQALLSALAQPDGTGAVGISFSVSPNNASVNPSTALTFSATVNSQTGGGTPSGTINFTDETTGNNLNSTPISLNGGGQATFTVSISSPTGNHNIIAAYSGDTTYEQLNSLPLTVNIQPSSTSTTVTPATYNPTPGTAFHVTVTLAVGNPPAGNSSPTGNISLTVDSQTPLTQQVTTSGGVTSATFSVTVSSSGPHTLAASYAGDANYQTSTSQTVTVTAATEAASVTLSVAPNQANLTYNPSAQLTFAAVVASQNGGGTPTGTFNFYDQATGKNLNPNPLTLDSTGKTTVTVNGGLPVNGNSIIGQYSGDKVYGSANSQALTVNIQPSSTTTTVKPSTTTPAVGVAFPVTATVTAGTPPAGQASPTGTMTLTLDGANPQNASVTTTGGVTSATFNVSVSTTGIHNLQAIYAGDSNYNTSTSTSVSVNGGSSGTGPTVTTLTANPATLTPGTPEALTATITAANPVTGVTNTFTGTLTFLDGTTLLGTATVVSNSATISDVTLTGTTHSITAVYSGDGNWAGSTSNVLTLQSASNPVTVTLTSSPAVPEPGQTVTLVATVTPKTAPPSGAEQNPTGSVIFYSGTTAIGTVALTPAQGDTSTASFGITSLPSGQGSFTAVYVGDQYFATATSNAITVTLQGFTISPAPGNPPAVLDIAKGGTGTAGFVIAGVGGFNSPLSVVCNVPFQADMTCAVSPNSVTPTQTVTLTITTYTSGGPSSAKRNSNPLWPPAAGGAALAALLLFFLPSGKRARMPASRGGRMLLLLLLLGGLGGAGIGCSSVNTVTPASVDGTPLGETTVSITAAANINNAVVSQTAYLSVNVVPAGSTGGSVPGKGAKSIPRSR